MAGSVFYDSAGYFAEFYREDRDGNGFFTRWYGTRAECESIAANAKPPRGARWQRAKWTPDRAPGSAAWCEAQGDNR